MSNFEKKIDDLILTEMCMSFRHDYGLLTQEEREAVLTQVTFFFEKYTKPLVKVLLISLVSSLENELDEAVAFFENNLVEVFGETVAQGIADILNNPY